MGWENIAENIRNRIEKFKIKNGSINVAKLEELIASYFVEMKNNEFFEDEFENTDDATLKTWLTRINARLKSVIITSYGLDTVISDNENYSKWITEERIKNEDWNYWKRYSTYLRKIGRPIDVINSTEKSTKEIIERLGDPKGQIEDLQKGLVLGSVQSGKTANFNGVLNRAIDVKYDVIIVFSGIMEDLRIQTQKRINKDVIGLGEVDGQINQSVGVGEVEQFGRGGIYQINSITSVTTDFKKSLIDANFDFSNQRILVCKKNVGVLTNLIYWLKTSMTAGADKLDMSLLVIDDEADNASLNNLGHKGIDYSSKVNGNIRALLNLFKRKSYLGYTATPFANILQDQNEGLTAHDAWKIPFRYNGEVKEILCSLSPSLFPDKFIYKLSSPSSYLGPQRFFSNGREQDGDSKIPLIETIPQPHEEVIIDFTEEGFSLRKSLMDAIDCFVLSIALRESRIAVLETLPGYTRHHSMLIHISRLIDEQNATADEVKKYVKYLKESFNSDRLDDVNGIYEDFKLQWNRFFVYQVDNILSFLPEEYNTDGLIPKKWDEISALLPHSIANIEVKAVNSKTGEKLDYPENSNKKYIAIGGNRLSRGFTLEGLTINYFLRDTNYYDTLLQMGRWFGYRPGYIDACRLFIDYNTEDKYNYITSALCELEELIESMEVQKKTPKEFELRIKRHPDVLKITRTSILKNAKEVKLSFQDQVQQTTIFKLERDRLESAWKGFTNLFENLYPHTEQNDKRFYLFSGGSELLNRFLELPNSFIENEVLWPYIKQYVEICNSYGKLTKWKIAIKRTGNASQIKIGNIDIKLTERRGPSNNEPDYHDLKNDLVFKASGKSRNIMTAGTDQAIDLSKRSFDEAVEMFREHKKAKLIKLKNLTEEEAEREANESTIPGWIFRKKRPETEGLLLIYLMDPQKIFHNEELMNTALAKSISMETPLIGYALSFPEIVDDPGAIYLANKIIITEEPDYTDDTEVPEDLETEINEIN